MPRRTTPLLLAACLSLVGLQLGGLHLHVGPQGFDARPHASHVHGAAGAPGHVHHDTGSSEHRHVPGAHDEAGAAGDSAAGSGHDHAGDRDVSIVELGSAVSKLLLFLIWLGAGVWLLLRATRGTPLPTANPPRNPARVRWRPPLRAPPVLSH